MHIAIDARELCGRPTGVGRYLSHLLETWGGMPEARRHRYRLYAPAALDLPAIAPRTATLDLSTHVIPGRPGTVWEQIRLATALRRHRPDVLFAPAYTSPLFSRTPTVLTVHDISFEAHPEWFRWREGARLRFLTRSSARRARLVLTDSEFSKREIVERLKIDADRVRVIRLGVSPVGSTEAKASAHETNASAHTILFVGSLFNRRRLPDLLAAFKEISRTHPTAHLDIVGENRTHPHQDLHAIARQLGLSDRVSLRSYVTDEELADLYGRARVFAFLSEYEGFGLTPLEALAAGVPIVVLDTPIARELYRDAAIYVQRGDIEGAAAALALMISNTEERRTILERAREVLRGFSWTDAARVTLGALVA